MAEEVLQVARRVRVHQRQGAMHEHGGVHRSGILGDVGQRILQLAGGAQSRPGRAESGQGGQFGEPGLV